MPSSLPLHGACSCGRNQYQIHIPADPSYPAQIIFDDTAEYRRAHSSPLPIFLRVPLPWLHSTTYAFYPDETHAEIRRVFTPRHAPQTKRHFCGFCGTPLSHWSEEKSEEAEWVNISLGSLAGDSLGLLGEKGWLPVGGEEVEEEKGMGLIGGDDAEKGDVEIRGHPWFEEMIEGSELGRIRRKKGGGVSSDGRTRVEWDIVEFGEDEDEDVGEAGVGSGKRKRGDLVEGKEVVMGEGH